MPTIEKEISIKKCYYSCPLFENDWDGMHCKHPYFDHKKPYEDMIITHANSREGVPEKCPLRIEELKIIKNYSLDNIVL